MTTTWRSHSTKLAVYTFLVIMRRTTAIFYMQLVSLARQGNLPM
jgi:hypothetical protein